MKENITIFDKLYPREKILEGIAINWAVSTGACDKCKYLKECETNENFIFPNEAPCIVKMAETGKNFGR